MYKFNMKGLHVLTFVLVMVGALNWGLVGLFNFNLLTTIFGSLPSLERIIYIAVGLSGIYLFAQHKKDCKNCGEKK